MSKHTETTFFKITGEQCNFTDRLKVRDGKFESELKWRCATFLDKKVLCSTTAKSIGSIDRR